MVRLVSIIILFLISLLAVLPAPAYYLWLLAIIASEFSVLFIGIVLLLLIAGIKFRTYQTISTIIGVAAIGLYLSPIIRAGMVADKIKLGMTTALSAGSDVDSQPFSVFKLFKPAPEVPFKTLSYVTYADTALTLNYYQSQVPGNRPCVIVVHGGSWAKGDKAQLPELNSYLATKGYNVAAIDYRKASKHISPAAVTDVAAALKYLAKNSLALNIDTNNFVLLGRSAGAQIALMAAYTLNDTRLKGVIDYYGPADMVWGYAVPGNPWIMDSRAVMEAYLGGTFDQMPQNYKNASPLEFVDSRAIPTLIIHGANDVLVAYEHSRRLDLKLEQYSVKHYWLELPWATHGFDYILNGPGGQLATYTVERFLKATCQ